MYMEPIVVSVITKSLMSVPAAINTISSLNSVICKIIETISKTGLTHVGDLMEFIVTSDIICKLQVCSTLLLEIREPTSQTVILCVNYIHNIINDIKHEMVII